MRSITKTPSEVYSFGLNYQNILKGAEQISTSLVSIVDTTTLQDVTNTFLSAQPVFITGVATGGSRDKLICTGKDFAALGVRRGFSFYNSTKKNRAIVHEVETTTNPFDTLIFSSPVGADTQAGDSFAFFLARIRFLAAGILGRDYEVTWTTTTTTGNTYVDQFVLKLRKN